jgi:phosphoenolpyruvate carboxykinase (ATP)
MQAKFIEETISQKRGTLLASGALAVRTGNHTGRSANSRFVVRDQTTEHLVDWGEVNKAFARENADRFFGDIQRRLADTTVYTVRGFIGPFPLEVKTTSSWHSAFAENMFREHYIERLAKQAKGERAQFSVMQIWHDPYTKASDYGITAPDDAFILLDLGNLRIAICGTAYAGEIKKSAFSMANFLLPATDVLPMHASANCLEEGSHSSVIFGLSGTGKTTLSAQTGRFLIGDDEIAWGSDGLSNLEGGCYAKLINLTEEREPDIFRAVMRFGSLLENVVVDDASRVPDFSAIDYTENTRGSYRLASLERVFDQKSEASHPETIVFLTADAFGALPAVARLDEWQMRYHFMSGFTAKVAGTEIGVKEPKAAFSACFGAPFMPRAPSVYANLLAKKARETGASVWLLNTGWVGGYQNGKRFPLSLTRHILEMIQTGEIERGGFSKHPIFGFDVPKSASGLEPEVLASPVGPQVEDLARRFLANQMKFKDSDAQEICTKGGPSVAGSFAESIVAQKAEKGNVILGAAVGKSKAQHLNDH